MTVFCGLVVLAVVLHGMSSVSAQDELGVPLGDEVCFLQGTKTSRPKRTHGGDVASELMKGGLEFLTLQEQHGTDQAVQSLVKAVMPVIKAAARADFTDSNGNFNLNTLLPYLPMVQQLASEVGVDVDLMALLPLAMNIMNSVNSGDDMNLESLQPVLAQLLVLLPKLIPKDLLEQSFEPGSVDVKALRQPLMQGAQMLASAVEPLLKAQR
uniref:Uncharacterized protein n=1 Tax=Noctiluca scintillans TaxID=2966 RepID=A0A7S0ZTS5_NOCSC|mmetsp:Transcript_18336/g.49286  ORF Transcript_18336/g.49286 Transcript_18336/m.49286 type:complete len:211 (+) Transcript_18336:58-690(+)|eukprot:CAMPEP_0194504126 /NCGR_PEP_ID=MMETSP0253-20130528/28769_1 /TAXON_ID=2966 /ORGANISM="Noctiluca scintillans" /LENGTH=210 /DNA_ID=CAMNT_0039346481 /DNA_START=16 /DNA_END=648 /DNA_ORIENTATION=+